MDAVSNIEEAQTVRPTKKQRELLAYIEGFIAEHGYSPSYREIMAGLNYTSVATVALHVGNLIRRGHVRKRDRSARSLEVITSVKSAKVSSNTITAREEKWLIEKVEHYVSQAESTSVVEENTYEELLILVGALRVLGLDGAAQSFQPRMAALKQKPAAPNGDMQ